MVHILVKPEQALVLEQEVDSLLRKGAIEQDPPPDMELRFFILLLHCSKEGWRVTSDLRLRQLNRSEQTLKFKTMTISTIMSQI